MKVGDMKRGLILFFVAILCLCAGCKEEQKKKPETSPEGLNNMAPGAPDGSSAAVDRVVDPEPNDTIGEAAQVPWSGDQVQVDGILSGGVADIDVFFLSLPESFIGLGVSAAPVGQGDLALGFAGPGEPTQWINASFAGGVEAIPNLKVGRHGTYLMVKGAGEQDLRYQLQLLGLKESAIELEPNDAETKAQSLAPGAQMVGYVNRSGDVDFFKIPGMTQGQPLSISVTPPLDQRLSVSLLKDGAALWSEHTNGIEPLVFNGLRPDPEGYDLRVEAIGESQRAVIYKLSLTQFAGAGLFEYEPNDEPAMAQSIVANKGALKAGFASLEDLDRFRVSVEPGVDASLLSVKAIPAEGVDLDLDIKLVEAGLSLTRSEKGPAEVEALCNLHLLQRTTLEILVKPKGDALGDYSLLIETRASEAEETEPNDTQLSPNSIEVGEVKRGFIHPGTDVDVYRFEVPAIPGAPDAVANIKAKIEDGFKANLILGVKDATFADVAHRDVAGWGEGESFEARLPSGSYYFVVKSRGGSACDRSYRLEVSVDDAYLQRVLNGQGTPVAPVADPLGAEPTPTPADSLPIHKDSKDPKPGPKKGDPGVEVEPDGAPAKIGEEKEGGEGEEAPPEIIDDDSF